MYKRCEEILKELENEGKLKVWWNFKFPEKEELKLRLKDMLEDNVDEKYYLSDDKVSKIECSNFMQEKKRIQEKEYSDTILARDWKDPKCVRVGGIFDTEKAKHQAGSVYDKEGLSPTLDVMQGGWRQPSIVEEKLPGAYGRDFGSKGKIQDTEGECDTLQAAMGNGGGNVPIIKVGGELEGQSGLIQPIDRKYKEHGLKREEHIEFKNDNCSHTLRASVIPVTAITMQQEEKILVNNGTKKGYDEAMEGDSINISYPNSKTRRGRVGHQVSQTLQCNDLMSVVIKPQLINNDKRLKSLVDKTEFKEGKVLNLDTYNQTTNENVSQTLTEPHHNTQRLFDGLRIRKLTPKECWRLMGFDDEDFEKAQKVNSNTQLYKQARKFDLRTSFGKNFETTILI